MGLSINTRRSLAETFNSPRLSVTRKPLDEVLLSPGEEVYPSHGHAVMLAGGAGSGKGFVIERILGIEGVVLDPDYLKTLVLRSKALAKKIYEETGYDITHFNLKNPSDTETLHMILSDLLGIMDKWKSKLVAGLMAAPANRKPNVIIDTTMSSMSRFRKETEMIRKIGYSPTKTHLVWVVTSIALARAQNLSRPRVVPDDILMETHTGAALTLRQIVDLGDNIRNVVDGTVAFVLNRPGVDNTLVTGPSGGSYLRDARIITIKRPGKPFDTSVLTAALRREIAGMVPPTPGGW